MTRHNDEYAPVLWANRENLLHHLQDDYVGSGMVVSIKPTEYCSAPLYASPQPLHTTNCCKCGRIIDTREKKDGGDDFGAQLNDGRWTCSIECDNAIVDPRPGAVPDLHKAAFEELRRRFDGFGDDVNHGSDRWFQGEKFMAQNIISLFKEIMRDFETTDGISSMTSPQPVINPTRSQVAGTPGLLTETKPSGHVELPQDVINLVVAAREAFDTGHLPDDENQALDKALEPFASKVRYANEPDDLAAASEGSSDE